MIEKNHGRIDVRRCYVFDQLDGLHAPERWPDLKAFAVIAAERTLKGKTTLEQRYYITRLRPDAAQLNHAVRQHWAVETPLHWCMDVVFADDQRRARTDHAAHNLSVVRHFALNLIRHAPEKRQGGLKAQRLRAASSVAYREELLGLL
jgi:predicted transposase YbfD/YdcC